MKMTYSRIQSPNKNNSYIKLIFNDSNVLDVIKYINLFECGIDYFPSKFQEYMEEKYSPCDFFQKHIVTPISENSFEIICMETSLKNFNELFDYIEMFINNNLNK